MVSPFHQRAAELQKSESSGPSKSAESPFHQRAKELQPQQKQEPFSFKHAAKVAGLHGVAGAGGMLGEAEKLASFINAPGTSPFKIENGKFTKGESKPHLKDVHQLTEQYEKQFDAVPENAIERIAAATFKGGGEGVPFGPAGVGVGAVFGFATSSLQELGVPKFVADVLAIGSTFMKPARIMNLWNEMKPLISKGASVQKAARTAGMTKDEYKQIQAIQQQLQRENPEQFPIIGKESPIRKEAKELAEKHDYLFNPPEAIEKDFRQITDDLIREHKTVKGMREDPLFKEKTSQLFDRLEQEAVEITEPLFANELKVGLAEELNAIKKKGITDSDYEKVLRKEVKKIMGDLSKKNENSFTQGIEQYRKNNMDSKGFYDPSKPASYNKAKREALQIYNRALEKVMVKNGTKEFKDLFKVSNEEWKAIHDYEAIEKFVDDMFVGKIDYTKAKKLLRKDLVSLRSPFQNIMGKENFKNFEELVENFLTTEQGIKQLRKASILGYDDLAKNAGKYLFRPKGITGIGYDIAKKMYTFLLDRPQGLETWKNAVKNFKSGNFTKAQEEIKKLDEISKNITQSSKEITKAPEKFIPQIKESIPKKLSTSINENITPLAERKQTALENKMQQLRSSIESNKEQIEKLTKQLKEKPDHKGAQKLLDLSKKGLESKHKRLDILEKEGHKALPKKYYEAKTPQQKKAHEIKPSQKTKEKFKIIRSNFDLKLRNGEPVTYKGDIYKVDDKPLFGIHRREGTRNYTVSHIPTGWSLGTYPDKKNAHQFTKEVIEKGIKNNKEVFSPDPDKMKDAMDFEIVKELYNKLRDR